MAFTPAVLFRPLAAVLVCGVLLGTAAPGLAAPWRQDATPTLASPAPTDEATPAETAAATAAVEPTAVVEATLPGTPAATAAPSTATTAPAGASAILTAVDSSLFPDLSAYMLVTEAGGARLGALTHNAIELSENGQPVRGLAVSETDIGVQVVFVIDANSAFKARDANGVTRLDYVKQALEAFANTPPRLKAGLDLVTVLAAEQALVERTDNPALVTQALSQYESTFGGAADPFPLLHRALDYALDVVPRPGMRRYIVYFSNGWNRFDVEAGLADVASRANGSVQIFPVFVGPVGAGNTLGAQNLQRLADAAGGERLIFSSPADLAPLFQLLSDRGRQYRLSYRSALSETGQHALVANLRLPGSAALTSNEIVFPLRVEPPVISLTGVPARVVRVAPAHDADPAAAEPASLSIPLSLDFPDGHHRGLRLAQLLVDGQVVVTQTSPTAFEAFAWPLAPHGEGEYQLQARIIDELGLAAESDVVPVTLSLQVPAAPAVSGLPEGAASWPLVGVAASGLGLALLVALGAWWWLARRQRLAEALAAEAALDQAALPARSAPRARPAAPDSLPPARPSARFGLPPVRVAVPGLRWPARQGLAPPRGACYFEVVAPGGTGAPRADIELLEPGLTLGRDAAVADTVFQDRSVSRLHARVLLKDHGVRIVDQGSTAGTWVNYAPVQGEAGCLLQHGDLVNLGRVQLRFLRRDAAPSNGNGARVIPAAPPPAPGAPAEGAPDKAGA